MTGDEPVQRVSKCVCPTCEGNGFVDNPQARYEQDYCAGRPTGVYSTNDPEEIDCPDCNGTGLERAPVPAPAPYAGPDKEPVF